MTATRVEVSLGMTHGLPNFSSIRIDVGIADDVRPNEDVDKAYGRCFDKVTSQLTARMQEALEALKED